MNYLTGDRKQRGIHVIWEKFEQGLCVILSLHASCLRLERSFDFVRGSLELLLE